MPRLLGEPGHSAELAAKLRSCKSTKLQSWHVVRGCRTYIFSTKIQYEKNNFNISYKHLDWTCFFRNIFMNLTSIPENIHVSGLCSLVHLQGQQRITKICCPFLISYQRKLVLQNIPRSENKDLWHFINKKIISRYFLSNWAQLGLPSKVKGVTVRYL